MKKYFLLFFAFATIFTVKGQTLYFPPLTGNTWDTIAPQSLNWCQSRIDSLYNYLQVKDTKSFIVLKNGKIVLEKYFGTYTKDSVFYWASASKALAAFITGVAQQKGFINVNNKVSQYIGTGWTSAPLVKENLITVKNLLQMNSGLDDLPPTPCDHMDTAKACLIYLADAGTRWGYHTGAYRKVQDVVSAAASQNYNIITNNWIEAKTGMSGFWFDQIYYSKARDMARFGLLNLNKGIWAADTVLKDSVFFKDMINTSQPLNQAYGYLWWLNGKSTFMTPQVQFTFNGTLMSNAPSDMYCALGKNDQKIYVVPSQKLVVIRQGNTAGGFNLAASAFDNTLWDYINKLNCTATSVDEFTNSDQVQVFPNPATSVLNISGSINIQCVSATNMLGSKHPLHYENKQIDCSALSKGIYIITIELVNKQVIHKKVVIN
jgi:CubicO group peptidase (beta-lactamase class C family)